MTTGTWQLVTTDGTVLDLDEAPYAMATAPAVFGAPPVSVEDDPYVSGYAGSRLRRDPRHTAATYPFRVRVLGDPDTIPTLVAALVAHLDATRGSIRLRYRRPDADEARELVGRAVSGISALTIDHDEMPTALVPVVFRAFDPYWNDLTPTVQTRRMEWDSTQAGGATPFDGETGWEFDEDVPFDGFLKDSETPFDGEAGWAFNEAGQPFDGAAGATQAADLRVGGDVAVWPTITITGPGDDLTITHTATGRTLGRTGTITAGRTITIVTDPSAPRSIIDNTDASVVAEFDTLEPFPLTPGQNLVSIRFDSATIDSAVRFEWTGRHLTC